MGGAEGRARLVGRDAELARLRAGLAQAADGRGSLVIVEGEAGVGKTRLIAALAEHAAASGLPTAWGTCLEDPAAPAYWPWRPALRALGITPAGSDPYELAERVIDGVAGPRSESAATPRLIVLDDLQWADASSLRLLEAIASGVADLPVLVIAVWRVDAAGPPPTLSGLRRARAAMTLALGGLDVAGCRELLAEVTSRPPDAVLAREVQERTGGNPFFVIELGRLGPRGAASVPASVRDAVTRRLASLTPGCRTLLGAAAVLGIDVELPLLAEVSRADPAAVRAAVEEARRAGFLRLADEPSAEPPEVGASFTHALVREAVELAIPPAERADLHRRAATVIAARTPDRLDALSFHLDRAAVPGDAGEAFAATVGAAEAAEHERAHEQAARYWRRARRHVELEPELADPARVLRREAEALVRAGLVEDAWIAAMELAELGRRRGDAAVLAEAALVVRGVEGHDAELAALCDEALAALPADGASDGLRAAMMGQRVIAACHLRLPPPPGVGAEAAIALASSADDPGALLIALHARQMELAGPAHVLERLALADRVELIAGPLGDEEMATWAATWRLDSWFELGRRPQLDRGIEALDRLAAETRRPLTAWRVAMARATLAQLEGRFADAERLGDEALRLGERGGLPVAPMVRMILQHHIGVLRGDIGSVLEHFAPVWAHVPPATRVYQAHMLAAAGQRDAAEGAFRATIGMAAEFPEDDLLIIELSALAETAAILGIADGTDVVRQRLEPYADQMSIAGSGHAGCGAPVAHELGLLAALAGDTAEAEGHFRDALAHEIAMGALPHAAVTRVAWARLLLGRGRAADLRLAEAMLDLAADGAASCGLAPTSAAVRALAPSLDGRRLLSPREREVAALVAEGLSNRAIAERLVLSERTAENHVKSILDKLGFDTRAQIAAWVASRDRRERWVPD